MPKRPSFQFYPHDWLTAADLRSCSPGARALWIDMLCWLHQGTPYGHARVNGKDILKVILQGYPQGCAEEWLRELESAGVFSKTEDGIIYCRRMVRDEKLRQVRAAGGVMGGNPVLKTQETRLTSKVNLQGYPSYEDEDQEEDSSKERGCKGKTKSRVFTKPSKDEARFHAAKVGLPESEVDRFLAYYESNGWRVGRNPMKCWRSAMSNWRANYEQRKYENDQRNNGSGRKQTASERRNAAMQWD